MRTTLDIPEQTLTEAMQLTHAKTKTAVIINALENLIRQSKLAAIKNYKGKIDMDINLETLRKR